MARDRRRAKQRQRRRGGDRQSARVAARSERERAPEPLEDSSAEVELAEAAIVDPPAAELGAEEVSEPQDDAVAERRPSRQDLDRAVAPSVPRREAPAAEPRPEGNRVANFLRACVAELRRVQWPDRRQVTQATGVVIGFVIIAGAYLGVLDAIFSRLVKFIL
jgi:preprotein translocase subunit SecE